VTTLADEAFETSDLQKEISRAVTPLTTPAAEDALHTMSVSHREFEAISYVQNKEQQYNEQTM
jgi:hypothetical protein